jgi:hypothetical protein
MLYCVIASTNQGNEMNRTPKIGEVLTLTIVSGGGRGRTEVYQVEVIETFAAMCRVRLPSGGVLRVGYWQLS